MTNYTGIKKEKKTKKSSEFLGAEFLKCLCMILKEIIKEKQNKYLYLYLQEILRGFSIRHHKQAQGTSVAEGGS